MPIYALVDGNSFYASCQIAFQPHLKNRPVVVLSNNDGCIVAANDIAKALDTPKNYGTGGYRAAKPTSMMFQPYFKVAALLKRHKAVIFSSNYELYQDMSQRMHAISAQFSDSQEIYSIDESFLDFSGLTPMQREQQAQQLKQRVMQWIGIPVAVGIGRTKTEAKLANHLAKKLPTQNGVMDLTEFDPSARALLYKKTPVDKVWGIGRQVSTRLQQIGINTVYDLQNADNKTLRKCFSVNLERTIRELNGQACFALQQTPQAKKSIVSSRSFGLLVDDFQQMRQAVSSYMAIAAEKLRHQQHLCRVVSVYISTPKHQAVAQYRNQHSIALVEPSDNTIVLNKMALTALKEIWRPEFKYQKAAVMLSGLLPDSGIQADLFGEPVMTSQTQAETSAKLMQTIDQINRKMGKKTLQLASCGQGKTAWQMKRNLISPRYTTRWPEIPVAKAN
ncbi:Y-family DNA polymerase [Thiomicrorhabdus sediminis]|uniref:Y-family DNA polymerase n=1 Tax=Thiomicrorhabdus sediminis TaxID=2580412 RepID=A0A4P9K7H5_9GAMM|nr:Y-family DNA polymerase [Thiomicrorhabdus sediminis]QCU90861.1 Y-family DNA polymerase [Thiomicrorhabdus sediminis]